MPSPYESWMQARTRRSAYGADPRRRPHRRGRRWMRTGLVVGRGANARELASDPTAHAEVIALRQAAAARGEWRLSGCTLVVTLEPCTMCAGAATLARVDRVVFGAWNPEARRCRVAVGPAARPAPQPPARGGRRRARGDLLGADRRVVRRPTGGRPRRQTRVSDPSGCSGTLVRGGVSERPKEHASKACEGATPPWVQIPPPPPVTCATPVVAIVARPALSSTASGAGQGRRGPRPGAGARSLR